MLTNRNVSIQFFNPELAQLFTKEELMTMLTELSRFLGKNGKQMIPKDGQKPLLNSSF
ncbi:hypothetical protein M3676_20605 [Metabacillus litoralis]|nr:hypothetical protein [Metabacillus litoralis]